MNRWIVLAAVAFFGVLLRFLRGAIHVTISVSGSPGSWKVTQRPYDFKAGKGDKIVWDIEFDKGAEGVGVSLRNFKHKKKPNIPDPFEGDVNNRKNHPDPKKIQDKVKGNAEPGPYKYDIYLGEGLALDPEIMIKP
ncbi:MAG: hypothetical protein LC804_07485 [Acidobacteria bacterium]|nr:hypothetical protein [Acidobacteriota bacterium]